MDFSQFSSAEQAHMTKVIEKKQVRRWCTLRLPDWPNPIPLDARFPENVLKSS